MLRIFLYSTGIVLALLFAGSAVAPKGDRSVPAGRTIASIQEEEFDDQLERLRLCYGIALRSPAQLADRRRSCKANVLQATRFALAERGQWLDRRIEFRCQDIQTAVEENLSSENKIIVDLGPNAESQKIKQILQNHSRKSDSNLAFQEFTNVCRTAVHCEKLLHYSTFSLPRLRACISGEGSVRHSVLFSALSGVFFAEQRQTLPLANRLLDGR